MESRKVIVGKISDKIVSVLKNEIDIGMKHTHTNDAEERNRLGIELARLQGKYEALIEAYDMLIGYPHEGAKQ